jgi:oxygen-independent coproporphyrinogen-3 oxidase
MSQTGQHLYMHIPFCDGKCVYCGFYSEAYAPDMADRYLDCLNTETALRVNEIDCQPETVYFGGGTPSILSAAQLAKLCRAVTRHSPLRSVKEWTVEANPGTLSPDKLHVLKKAGVNRISIGAQSFDDTVLRSIGRRHSSKAIGETVAAIRADGIDNIGLDLIAALPGVSGSLWQETVIKAIDLGPQHISVYALTVEHGSRLLAPDEDSQLRATEEAETLLTAAGYVRYEISNYAKPGFEAQHNVSCWRGEDYLGFGPAAASRAGLKRWTNKPNTKAYIEALTVGRLPPRDEESMCAETDATERLIFSFRLLTEGVDLGPYEAMRGNTNGRWLETLQKLAGNGLVEERASRWFLTRRGCNMADLVAGELMG